MLPTSGRAALFDLVLCRYQVKSSGCASFICLLEMEVAGQKLQLRSAPTTPAQIV